MRTLLLAIAALGMLALAAPARADVGDTWSCAKSRWGGEIGLVQYPDRVMLYSADGYPMAAIRDGGVTVHCGETDAAPTWFPTWFPSPPPIYCSSEHFAGPVYLAERIEGGKHYVIVSQAGMGIYRIARDRSTVERSEDGCPAPPPAP